MLTNEQRFLNSYKKVMIFFGVWLPPQKHVIIHKTYMMVIMLSQYSFLLFELLYIANVWGDLSEVSEASYLLFTQAALVYKTTVFLLNKNNMIELLDMMESDMFQPKTDVDERVVRKHVRSVTKLCLLFLCSALAACSCWTVMPLLDYAGERTFPFKIWMPVRPAHSPEYQLGYAYQVIAIFISALLFMAVDGLPASFIMFGCAQLDMIANKLHLVEGIGSSSKSNLKKENQKRMKRNYEIFTDCIKHHQGIISFIEKVEGIFHATIFFQIGGSVAIICITGLRISMVTPGTVQFYAMVNYFVTMTSQLFLYCWCGNELTKKSEELPEAIYQSQWYDQELRFQSSMSIAMERMRIPIVFRAGYYIPLSRQTFISVLRSSYSYFAVLNQVNST